MLFYDALELHDSE